MPYGKKTLLAVMAFRPTRSLGLGPVLDRGRFFRAKTTWPTFFMVVLRPSIYKIQRMKCFLPTDRTGTSTSFIHRWKCRMIKSRPQVEFHRFFDLGRKIYLTAPWLLRWHLFFDDRRQIMKPFGDENSNPAINLYALVRIEPYMKNTTKALYLTENKWHIKYEFRPKNG